jgi:ABC-type Fe3+-citrate transport system substrate-binding protein
MAENVERPNTVAGLIEKRREITGKIEHHQRILNELIIDLDHLDHTIRLFAPELDVSLAQPKQFPARHAAFRGEMQRFVLGALRAATGPLTSLEIAVEVVKARGLDPNDPALGSKRT